MTTKPITFNLNLDLIAAIEARAKAQGCTTTDVVTVALLQVFGSTLPQVPMVVDPQIGQVLEQVHDGERKIAFSVEDVVLASLMYPDTRTLFGINLFDGPITITDLGFTGGIVFLQSPPFYAYGTVLLDATKTFDDEYELGLMQTLYSSTGIKIFYLDGNGNAYQTWEQYYTTIPVRDGVEGTKPWYGLETVASINFSNGVSGRLDDRPQVALRWMTPDGIGTLSSCSGTDEFCTWLVLRQKASGDLSYLKWTTWSVDWSCNFDFGARTGVSIGGGKLLLSGDGQGFISPLTDDPVANSVKDSRIL